MVDLISESLKRLLDAKKEVTEAIANGSNIQSFDTYQRLVGRREGLSEALAIIEEIISEDDENL
jgi:uncharacterized protein with gpF-like domain